ncbi:DUF3833 family protein [uncultured Sulfitobacter sp.]|uniref:DUF3833 family protein n=1 Tax=uncultured Sulfitobacter sp. TaxID=191468 RepID=UPI00262CA7D5|nr:DUF3833 family protein [uncultured Sulfitobacter sp.]
MSEALVFFLFGGLCVSLLVFLRRRFAGFAGQRASDYADFHPEFDMQTCLDGAMQCDGVIFGPFGRMTSSFEADFDVNWEGNTGTIDAYFRYNDGSSQKRRWTIRLDGKGGFDALADDVPGKGRGNISGCSVIFRYLIDLPPEAGGHRLSALDCMYLAPNDTVVNRSQFRKFGFKVAELVATIKKKETA